MKRIVPLLVLVLALAVPVAAYADDPPAQPAASQPAAQAGGHHGGAAARLRRAKLRLRKALRHCKQQQSDQRQACLQRIVDRLELLKSRIDKLEAKIQERCPGAVAATDPSSAPAPTAGDKCSRAPRLLARLDRIKARIDKLETRMNQYLSGDSSSSSDSGSASSDGSSADADSIASLEAQLNAVASQTG